MLVGGARLVDDEAQLLSDSTVFIFFNDCFFLLKYELARLKALVGRTGSDLRFWKACDSGVSSVCLRAGGFVELSESSSFLLLAVLGRRFGAGEPDEESHDRLAKLAMLLCTDVLPEDEPRRVSAEASSPTEVEGLGISSFGLSRVVGLELGNHDRGRSIKEPVRERLKVVWSGVGSGSSRGAEGRHPEAAASLAAEEPSVRKNDVSSLKLSSKEGIS